MQCTITNVGSAPWAYAQLGVRKTFQCNCGARNACVFGVHSRLRSSSTRQKAQGIPPQVTARPTQPGARQREGPRVTLTGVVETAEAERLEMYLRSVWCMQPKTVTWYPLLVFVFDGGIQIRVAWRIGQAHDRALIATTTAGSRWCRYVSAMWLVRKNTMKNTIIFGAIGIFLGEIYEIQFR